MPQHGEQLQLIQIGYRKIYSNHLTLVDLSNTCLWLQFE